MIKCEGGVPCEHCTRTHKICQPQRPSSQEVKFITVGASVQPCPGAKLPLQLQKHSDDLYLDHFASFMQHCHFTHRFGSVASGLLPLLERSNLLQDLAVAIGALDASRRGSIRSSASPKYIAFRSYGRSIQSLQCRLEDADAARSEDVFWGTFLLGLFEVS